MKKFLSLMLLFMFSAISVDASVYKGQRAYMKLCKACHKSGGKLAKSHTQEEWDEYFDNDAKLLKNVHEKDADAMQKLESDNFEKYKKHMKQFFHKYASDSGNVPACN